MSEFSPLTAEVQLATADDLQGLFDLLDAANKLSVEKSGIPGWRNIEMAQDDIKRCLAAGDVFAVRDRNGDINSTITLGETNIEWGKVAHDNKALYFTKYMKDPTKTQPGDAIQLLMFSVEEAKRRNKMLIRCDVVADQPGIVAYYKDGLGFVEKGRTVYESSGREGLLLETSAVNLATRLTNLK